MYFAKNFMHVFKIYILFTLLSHSSPSLNSLFFAIACLTACTAIFPVILFWIHFLIFSKSWKSRAHKVTQLPLQLLHTLHVIQKKRENHLRFYAHSNFIIDAPFSLFPSKIARSLFPKVSVLHLWSMLIFGLIHSIFLFILIVVPLRGIFQPANFQK